MRYKETREQSAEILRQVIPEMSRHQAAFHPLTYTVFYEYITGCNPELGSALSSLIEGGHTLGDGEIARLFDAHILAGREQAVRQTCDAVRTLISDVGHSTQTADARAGAYVESLARIGRQLENGVGDSALMGTVRSLIDSTGEMRDSVTTLRRQLIESTQRIEELQTALTQARHQALVDPLTGLANRRGFEAALEAALALESARQPGNTCLLMIDIDFFKRINDQHGHLVGDRVIRSVARALKDSVKGKDTVARVGGEEFSVLLPDTPVDGARALAEQLRATIEQGRIRRTDTQATIATVTVSIGVSAYRSQESTDEFIRRADTALYAAKNAGRNRVVVEAASMRAA